MANAQRSVSEDSQPINHAPRNNVCPIHRSLDKKIDGLTSRGINHEGVTTLKKLRLRQKEINEGIRSH